MKAATAWIPNAFGAFLPIFLPSAYTLLYFQFIGKTMQGLSTNDFVHVHVGIRFSRVCFFFII